MIRRSASVPRVVQAAGLRITFERLGSGPALLLLHGLPGRARFWRRQSSLADEFTVIAWDMPGCGDSEAPPGEFGIEEVAEILVAFIRALGLDRPHVAGLSWGGGLALELYRQAPGIPRTLGLISAYAGWAGSLSKEATGLRLAAYERAAAGAPDTEAMRAWIPGLVSAGASEEVREEVLEMAADYDPRVLGALARSFAATDLRAMLPTIAVPTLLLYGSADTRSPRYVADDLHRAIPGSRLVVLDGPGHVCNIEAADRFNAELRAFLREAG